VQLRKFSKGMLQRAGIAKPFAQPQTGLLRRTMSAWIRWDGREVRDLMEQLKQEGKTVFFSYHIL